MLYDLTPALYGDLKFYERQVTSKWTVCWSLLLRGGIWSGGGVWSGGGGCLVYGVSGPGGSAPRGVWSGGYIPACTEADPPPVDRQTPVKILPWPNFVAAGNYGSPLNEDRIYCDFIFAKTKGIASK